MVDEQFKELSIFSSSSMNIQISEFPNSTRVKKKKKMFDNLFYLFCCFAFKLNYHHFCLLHSFLRIFMNFNEFLGISHVFFGAVSTNFKTYFLFYLAFNWIFPINESQQWYTYMRRKESDQHISLIFLTRLLGYEAFKSCKSSSNVPHVPLMRELFFVVHSPS